MRQASVNALFGAALRSARSSSSEDDSFGKPTSHSHLSQNHGTISWVLQALEDLRRRIRKPVLGGHGRGTPALKKIFDLEAQKGLQTSGIPSAGPYAGPKHAEYCIAALLRVIQAFQGFSGIRV